MECESGDTFLKCKNTQAFSVTFLFLGGGSVVVLTFVFPSAV